MDKYIKGKKLGEGSFGITYLCTEIATGLQYACKSISKQNLFLQGERELVEYEIEILRFINVLKHPNIAAFKDAFEDAASMNIVMELCEGGTLFEHICNHHRTFKEPQVARMIREIASALEACHNSNIVHRDLKLGNLLFKTKDKDSTLKLIDFGCAKFCTSNEELTEEIGTAIYVAPEILEGHYGPKVDIWSTGVILYILLTGLFPFKADTLEDTYKESMEKKNELFAKKRWRGISNGAKDLTQRMMAFDVNQRLNASEVLEHPWIKIMSIELEERIKNSTQTNGVGFCKCM